MHRIRAGVAAAGSVDWLRVRARRTRIWSALDASGEIWVRLGRLSSVVAPVSFDQQTGELCAAALSTYRDKASRRMSDESVKSRRFWLTRRANATFALPRVVSQLPLG